MKRVWNQFDTIYEEEHQFSSPSLSPSSPPSLYSIVNAWSLHSGYEPDVLIFVQGTSFRLHKERMISRSSYLKRHLTGVSNLTLSPPLNITAKTFAAVAEFCYSGEVHLSPINVAAVRVAAELLGMTGEENLRDVMESYFERMVGIDASMVLRSCVALLPEAETTASLASRCIEALIWEDDFSCFDDVVGMHPRDFQTVSYSLNRRLPNHDVLYKIVDRYLKENKYGKLTEEQKTEICNSIDCSKVSCETLVECVQNPRMPLRFIVRAILMEHLNTRRSVTATQNQEPTTLGQILQRDTAHSQTTHIKHVMDSTYTRIQTLEKDLLGMKTILHQSQDDKTFNSSFHFVPPESESSKIQRGERGSVSSSAFIFDNLRRPRENNQLHKTSNLPNSFPHRLISALKNAFRISNSTSNTKQSCKGRCSTRIQ